MPEASFLEHLAKHSHERDDKMGRLERPFDATAQTIRLISSVPAEVAVKVYSKEKMKSSVRKKIIQNEFEVLSRINHPRIIRFYQKVETKRQIHLLMEYFRGQGLDSFLKRFLQKRVPQKIGKPILRQILEGLEYLHLNHIYHRGRRVTADLKLENVMINSDMEIKLIDFGFSVATPSDRLDLFCGTPNYMSPEIVLKKEYCGRANDIWGFAVLAFKLLTGEFPFGAESTSSLNKKILSLNYQCPGYLSEDVKRIFFSCFKIAPQARPSVSQLLKLKFFN